MTDLEKLKLAKEVLEEQISTAKIDYGKLSTAKSILDSIFAKDWLKRNNVK